MIPNRKELFDCWAVDYDKKFIIPDKSPFEGYEQVLEAVLEQARAKPEIMILDSWDDGGFY